MALTFVLAMFGWVLFRASTMGGALHHFEAMFGLAGDDVTRQLFVAPLRWAAFAVAAIVVWGFPTTQAQVHAAKPGWVLSLQPLFVLALVHLHYENDVPFLYFQF
jgi:hypothetical protein